MSRKLLLGMALLCLFFTAFLCSCGTSEENSEVDTNVKRTTLTEFLTPEATGEDVFATDHVEMDLSKISEGYLMVCYSGDAAKAKLMVTVPDGETRYIYTLTTGEYDTVPLTCGDGTYQINVCEQITGNQYAVIASTSCEVALSDEFRPFLYPNTYVWYTADSDCVKLGEELSDNSSTDLDFVENVYNYVVTNISYDTDRAESVGSDYVPDLNAVLSEKKGICFDYSALMTAILRSQGIPTKMVFGYSGTAYHAWISVYLDEIGWVDDMIEFDGKTWSLMDPTLDANTSNSNESVEKYVGDSSHYIEKYWY